MTAQLISNVWKGDGFAVEVLYSRAGVGTQILVSSDEGDILLDVGDGTLRDLLSKDYEFSRLKGIVITHGHCDHMGGLWTLIGLLRIIARREELAVVMPKGSKEPEELISKFLECYPDTMPFEISILRAGDGSTFRIAGYEIKATELVHRGSTFAALGDFIPALGYSIEYRGQRIAFSGDTDYCENLERLVAGADLALIEATWGKEKNLGHEGVHLTVEEAIKAGELAKQYKLIHFTKKSKKYFDENYC